MFVELLFRNCMPFYGKNIYAIISTIGVPLRYSYRQESARINGDVYPFDSESHK